MAALWMYVGIFHLSFFICRSYPLPPISLPLAAIALAAAAPYNRRMDNHDSSADLEVQFKPDQGKAIIEGKTAVPFQSFVTLILQKKVLPLCKQWGREPIVISSELLTTLASAPQDSQENRSHPIMVAIGIGLLLGIGGFAVTEVILETSQIFLTRKDLLMVAGSIFAVLLLGFMLMRVQRVKRGERIVESVEKISNFLSGK